MAPGLKLLSFLALGLAFTGSSIANTATTEGETFYPIDPPKARRAEPAQNTVDKITDVLRNLPTDLVVELPTVSGLTANVGQDGEPVDLNTPATTTLSNGAITYIVDKITDILGLDTVPVVTDGSKLTTRGETNVNHEEAEDGESFYPIVPPGCVEVKGRLQCRRSTGEQEAAVKRVVAVRRPSAR